MAGFADRGRRRKMTEKNRPVFAVVRYETLSKNDDPTLRWTIVGVYADPVSAQEKAAELGAINSGKGAIYFVQQSRMKGERTDTD